MVTIRTIENIKLGSKITLINGIYAILLGIFYLIYKEFILKISFRAFDASWGFFDRYSPEISALFSRLFILVGLIIIASGICIIYLSYQIHRKKEKDLWIVLLVIGMIFWSGLFIIEALNKNVYTTALSFIGWLSFIIGTVIPIKYYVQRVED